MYCRFKMFWVGVLSVYIFFISCKPNVSVPEKVTEVVPAAPLREAEQKMDFLSLLDSVPMTLTLDANQLREFWQWWDTRWEGSIIYFDLKSKDSLYQLYFKLKPGFRMIQSLKPPFYLRYNYSYADSEVTRFDLITDPDSMNRLDIPIITKDVAKRLLNTQDTVFLFYSFQPRPDPYQTTNKISHLLYQPKSMSYKLMTLDTQVNIIDSVTLVSIKQGDKFSVRFPAPSALQLLKHTIIQNDSYTFLDSAELKRVYIDSSGHFYDWTQSAFNPEKFCVTFPPDSTFRGDIESVKTPLSLKWEVETRPIFKSSDPYFNPDRGLYEPYPISLFYYQYLISETSSTYLFTVIGNVGKAKYLVLTDKRGNIKDVENLYSIMHQNQIWSYAEGRLARDGTIYMVGYNGNKVDTLGKKWVDGNHILSQGLPKLSVTMPISNLDEYFSFHGLKEFNLDSLPQFYSYDPYMYNYKQFPDTIYKCIEETAEMNEGSFFGKNYNITHASNGLTYLVMEYSGGLSNSLNLFVINKENVMQPNSLQLAEMGGDAGDTWNRWGYFVNDSTYSATILSCSISSGDENKTECDSILTVYNILSDGRIRIDDSKTRKYKTVRIYE